MSEHAVILSISSDIGYNLAMRWLGQGLRVSGTYRTESSRLRLLENAGADLVWCDLQEAESVSNSANRLVQGTSQPWTRLVLAAGSQNPIGLFGDTLFDEWSKSLEINFLNQLRFLHTLVSISRPSGRVLLFAGGATNRATTHYSAYTISKIASIKMVELLAAEYPEACFSVLGPGWVKTKIHNATLQGPPSSAGPNFLTTLERFQKDDFFPMDMLLDCIDWLFMESRERVNGRNFSAVHDSWGTPELQSALDSDENLYKLRRSGNDRVF